MKLNRTIYADREGMISQLQTDRDQAQANAETESLLRYRREYWRGRAEGLNLAISLLRDWAGEEEPDEQATPASSAVPPAQVQLAEFAEIIGGRNPYEHPSPGDR